MLYDKHHFTSRQLPPRLTRKSLLQLSVVVSAFGWAPSAFSSTTHQSKASSTPQFGHSHQEIAQARPVAAAKQAPKARTADNLTSQKVEDVLVSGGRTINGPRSAAKPMLISNSPLSDIAVVSHLDNEQIRNTPVHVSADLLRSIPGFQVDDFQDGGIAQGIGARGWSTESDGNYVATYIDGSIRNVYSGVLNGYNDLNPLIPELINGLTVISGPFDVRYGGNFASAGSALFTTRDDVATGISASGGSYGKARVLGTYGKHIGNVTVYSALEGMYETGYRQNGITRRINSFSKAVVDISPEDTFKISAQGYWTDYGQPGSIPLNYIQQGLISERAPRSDQDRGANNQYTLNAQFEHVHNNFTLDATLFFNKTWLIRQITLGLPGTVTPQREYLDDRYTLGAAIEPYWKFHLPNGGLFDIKTGITNHIDWARDFRIPGHDGVAYTAANSQYFSSFLNMNRFMEDNLSTYLSTSISPLPWIKMTGGARYDHFFYSINNTKYNSATGGLLRQRLSTSVGTPTVKAAIAINPYKPVTIFVNYGQSVTSPDANSDITVNPSLAPTLLTSGEAGIRYDYLPLGAHIQGSSYKTIDSNEIGVNQATLQTQNMGKSYRWGFDTDAAITLLKYRGARLDLHGSYNWVHARLNTSTNNFIPNVADWLISYGLNATVPVDKIDRRALIMSFDHHFVGPQPLDKARNYTAPQYQRLSARLMYNDKKLSNMRIWMSAIVFPTNRFAEDAWISGSTIYTAPQPRLMLEGGFSFGL
ncbi:TonB-dependent receptor [Acetobacter okinawensis]|uniref:TonB-dependent receptor n=1 Tax=Acetobacter okinawensis TaxID=1076594 RepID=UPI00209D9AED|nr:TonB-dependent receptor plug domain-containing protein [Acetobacter okinawensis]MCP1214340.1 TonB-dependent receptor plug domain-containing protein [Acetobacter okinawensis]